jgi:3-hydroxybutyryl-CoA dehydrogenase
MAIRTVGVLGCGLMGSGIAQVAAAPATRRSCARSNDTRCRRAGRIRKFLADGVRQGQVTEDAQNTTLGEPDGHDNTRDLKDCDIVIEAIVENLDEKARDLRGRRSGGRPETIIASNTSSLCITELAAATKRPDRFGGLHFFNPVPLMKLVEVIPRADDERRDESGADAFRVIAWQGSRSPLPIVQASSSIGLLVPYLLDAIREYERGLGTVEDIDKGMKLGCGHPMGPFTLLDFVGLDTTYYIANIMFDEFREPRFAPPAAAEADGAGRVSRAARRSGLLHRISDGATIPPGSVSRARSPGRASA